MLKVGITGGIGSGKTWVCRVFQHLGVPLFNADEEVKNLYQTDETLKGLLITEFGNSAYTPSGDFNKAFFREILVDSNKRETLNQIVHPLVFKRFEEWSSEQKSPYVIKEAAILFESGADKTVDKSIGVFAPLEIRMERVIARDNRTREEVQTIMNMQLSDDALKSKVDYTIINDNEHGVIDQVRALHQVLVNEARHF
jgi:dephospho-CoA kinase